MKKYFKEDDGMFITCDVNDEYDFDIDYISVKETNRGIYTAIFHTLGNNDTLITYKQDNKPEFINSIDILIHLGLL
jgi:hypothetical protein